MSNAWLRRMMRQQRAARLALTAAGPLAVLGCIAIAALAPAWTAVLGCLLLLVLAAQAVAVGLLLDARADRARASAPAEPASAPAPSPAPPAPASAPSVDAEALAGLVRRAAREEVDRGVRQHARELQRLRREMVQESLNSVRQGQALQHLLQVTRPARSTPGLGGWAASPDLLSYAVQLVADRAPRLVVECGSGASTLFLALAVDRLGLETRIVAVDHDDHYAEATRRELRAHGVDHIAEVRTAPLEPTGLEGHETPWYGRTAFDDLDGIGVLLVDGPPEASGPHARWPAIPVLRERLAPGAVILMDDFRRDHEQEAADAWLEMLPGSHLEHVDVHKGLGVIRLS